MSKVLCIAVHPDDETLGCGGTLLKHKSNGDEIHWLICTQTEEKKDFYKTREEEIKKVTQLYNFDTVSKIKLNSMRVDEVTISELIEKISKVINKIQPEIVYMPFKNDVHSDHRIIFDAAYSCTKSFRYPFIKKIYMMETLSETEFAVSSNDSSFVPNSFSDISDFIDKKIEIMKIFKSEMKEHPFPRSVKTIEALATYRGATCGANYAESFILIKEIN